MCVVTLQLPGDAAFPGAMPVLLYVAGGGFMAGASGMYKSKYFMDEDVVFVGVNSRFMAFGNDNELIVTRGASMSNLC